MLEITTLLHGWQCMHTLLKWLCIMYNGDISKCYRDISLT